MGVYGYDIYLWNDVLKLETPSRSNGNKLPRDTVVETDRWYVRIQINNTLGTMRSRWINFCAPARVLQVRPVSKYGKRKQGFTQVEEIHFGSSTFYLGQIRVRSQYGVAEENDEKWKYTADIEHNNCMVM
jgi:hypothetical protein